MLVDVGQRQVGRLGPIAVAQQPDQGIGESAALVGGKGNQEEFVVRHRFGNNVEAERRGRQVCVLVEGTVHDEDDGASTVITCRGHQPRAGHRVVVACREVEVAVRPEPARPDVVDRQRLAGLGGEVGHGGDDLRGASRVRQYSDVLGRHAGLCDQGRRQARQQRLDERIADSDQQHA
ncbi:hypothetical protein [Kutzneria sp. CA-103260]|uniref:hypothetical protein n=1 Tax=Kutzneria sp. CA-103260 TaxID=2802641 RepID=UPI001BA7706D|nr:hypothetical protein [Kutzneria sp. CA-103260]